MATPLETLIAEAAGRTMHGTLSVAVEKMAEELAREMLAEPEFRAAFQALVRQQAHAIVAHLTTASKRRRNGR